MDFSEVNEKAQGSAEKKAKRQEKAKTLWPEKVKRPKALTHAQVEKICWDECSLYIRARDFILNKGLCWYCGIRPIQCAMHRHKRRHRATRYDERNLHGGCHTCNKLDGDWGQTQRYDGIFMEKLGYALWKELESLTRTTVQFSKADLIEMAEGFRTKRLALANTM